MNEEVYSFLNKGISVFVMLSSFDFLAKCVLKAWVLAHNYHEHISTVRPKSESSCLAVDQYWSVNKKDDFL